MEGHAPQTPSAASAAAPEPDDTSRFPHVPVADLDTVWFQVAGTICNLRCTHCLISCAPDNHSFGMMTLEQIRPYLEQARELGVREYYFTGGEPFMNREMFAILEETLRQGPATVLTNGLLLDERKCRRLRELDDASEYSLDLRVSFDGVDPEAHDAIRGPGTFERALNGVANLVRAGLVPVLTVTEVDPESAGPAGRQRLMDRLRHLGVERVRIKILGLFHIGREAERSRPYERAEVLTVDAVEESSLRQLQCASGRMVTDQGVWVCPILIDSPEGRMGDRLDATLRPYELSHQACYTCYVDGVTCRT